MLCPACSADATADSVYCPKCGHRLEYPAPPGAKQLAQTPAERMRGDRGPSEPERPLWEGTYSPKAMYGSWLLAILVTIAAIVLAVIFWAMPPVWLAAMAIAAILWVCLGIYYLYERLSVHYTLSTQRFVHHTGILRRVINRIEVIDIDDVTVEQGLIERMFGVGTIRLLSSDTSDPKLFLRGIDDVKRVAAMIDDVRRDERRKRGMYIETV